MASAILHNPGHPAPRLFESLVERDYESLLTLYATNARNSVVSYLTMKSRWAQQQENYTKSEEKLDEFLQQISDTDGGDRRLSPLSVARNEDDNSFFYLLQELGNIIASNEVKGANDNVCVSKESDRLVWEASAILSDSRPPSNFCVYNKEGATTPPAGGEQIPPIFDGSVANATPPPLGGTAAGASGGTGTVLHLACALDQPLMLALFLSMGADGRASHTAFRRLMIHEAACNGSINCLKLLLEMGQKYAQAANTRQKESAGVPFFPDSFELAPATPFPGSSVARAPPPIAMNIRHFRRESHGQRKGDFLSMLRQFQNCYESVRSGKMSELEAARALLQDALLLETTRNSLIRSCAFKPDTFTNRTFLRPNGCADGHGNTPLHWAAFKNETQCVSLLLQYDANPNARAHPSGWTPLHDAAYSDSSESIELLVNKGAHVDARANSGATPLCFAAQEDAAAAAQLLLERGADLTARCAGAPQEDGMQQAHVPNHPHSRFSGYTPLHYCAHYNAHCAAKVLLKNQAAKAAMETPDLSCRLPIHVAVARGSSDVLRELLHAGARVDIRPGTGPGSPTGAILSALQEPIVARRPPSPEEPATPNRARARAASASSTRSSASSSPVTSPVLRSMIPSQPITSSKPWNCLSQQAIDECKELISKAELSWSPDRHLLFTPQDRKAVMMLLRVGKRLEQNGTGIFIDLWPLVLSFCGRGWFEAESSKPAAIEYVEERSVEEADDAYVAYDSDISIEEGDHHDEDYLSLPNFGENS